MKKVEFWFAVGSQTLYGPEVLQTVEQHGQEMAAFLSEKLPFRLVYKNTIKAAKDILQLVAEANTDPACAGLVTWCHTFSPSKMWAQALQKLQKPWCHFATQYHDAIPADSIDMDFMNLNQAAHGDREHGFIGARLRKNRQIVVGHWKDPQACAELGEWMRGAVAAIYSSTLRILRFGDNMRDVAVTEGDKIEALTCFGWQVDYWPVGYLVACMAEVSDKEVEQQFEVYRSRYRLQTEDLASVRYQARIECAMRRILKEQGGGAVVTNFQDLYGLEQLPGLAIQNLMADGYGFGAEGDWKIAGLTAVMKKMGEGLPGGCSFVEDYTYNYTADGATELAAHMLEICPSLSTQTPRIEVHPLSIGERKAPARLVFDGMPGPGVVTTLLDIGGRMRMILQEVDCIPCLDMPKLPVARVMWNPQPDLKTVLKCWILAGGGHHSVLTTQVGASVPAAWAEIMDIELLRIDRNTSVEAFADKLRFGELYWRLK